MADLGQVPTTLTKLHAASAGVHAIYDARSILLGTAGAGVHAIYDARSIGLGTAYASSFVILSPSLPIGTPAPLPDVVIDPCHVRDGSILRNGIHDHGATCLPAALPPTTLNPTQDPTGTPAPAPDVVINPCHVRDGSILRNGVHDHGATCLPAEAIPGTGILNPQATPTGTPAETPIAPAAPADAVSAIPAPAKTTKTVLRRYGVAGSVGIDRQTGKPITGLAYLRDRMASCFSMRLGTHPMRRLKGSRIPELLDRPLNKATLFELQIAAMDALSSAQNGFADLQVLRTSVEVVSAGKVAFSVLFKQQDLPETLIAVEVPI